MILQPGTYVFQLENTPLDRDMVHVFDKDRTHLLNQFPGDSRLPLGAHGQNGGPVGGSGALMPRQSMRGFLRRRIGWLGIRLSKAERGGSRCCKTGCSLGLCLARRYINTHSIRSLRSCRVKSHFLVKQHSQQEKWT